MIGFQHLTEKGVEQTNLSEVKEAEMKSVYRKEAQSGDFKES